MNEPETIFEYLQREYPEAKKTTLRQMVEHKRVLLNGAPVRSLKQMVTAQDKVEVKYFVNDKRFPPGFQPAYAVKDGYLLLTSTPEAVRSFKVEQPRAAAEDTPILRASLKGLRDYLKERREPLLDYLAEKNRVPREEAMRRLDGLRLGLQFLERIELTLRTEPGQVNFTLRVQTTQALRK